MTAKVAGILHNINIDITESSTVGQQFDYVADKSFNQKFLNINICISWLLDGQGPLKLFYYIELQVSISYKTNISYFLVHTFSDTDST